MRTRLLTDTVVAPQLLESRLRLIRQLSTLAKSGRLSPRLHPPDPRSARLAVVLRALEASLANVSQREIAGAILGRQRVNADWADPRDHLRDHTRRAVRRGRWLMQTGYLGLLK